MNEMLGAYSFIMDRLTGTIPSDEADKIRYLVGDRIYAGIAPPKATYPLVVVQALSSQDKLVVGGESSYLVADLAIKVVDTGGYEVLGEIDQAIFEAIQRSSGVIESDTGGTALNCMGVHRVNTMITERAEGDTIYRTILSTWRVRIHRIDPL